MTSHRIYTLIASAAAGAALFGGATALSPAAQATTGDFYTVIAYSPITGYTGWANNATTLEEATHVALGNCQQRGDGCQVTSWARNGCAALALGSSRWGGGWATNANDAQADALAKVTSGRVVELHCTG
jgi:hypothetical protein